MYTELGSDMSRYCNAGPGYILLISNDVTTAWAAYTPGNAGPGYILLISNDVTTAWADYIPGSV